MKLFICTHEGYQLLWIALMEMGATNAIQSIVCAPFSKFTCWYNLDFDFCTFEGFTIGECVRSHIFSISKCTLSTTRIQIQNTQMNHKTKLDVNPHLLFLDVHVFMCHFLNFNIVGHQSNSTNRFSPRHLSQPHSDLLLRNSKCNHRQEPLLPMVLLHLFFLASFLYT